MIYNQIVPQLHHLSFSLRICCGAPIVTLHLAVPGVIMTMNLHTFFLRSGVPNVLMVHWSDIVAPLDRWLPIVLRQAVLVVYLIESLKTNIYLWAELSTMNHLRVVGLPFMLVATSQCRPAYGSHLSLSSGVGVRQCVGLLCLLCGPLPSSVSC